MSNRFNYFMATPYLNPSRKAQTIEKVTNELPQDEKTEDVTIKAQQEQIVNQEQAQETIVSQEISVTNDEPVENITFEQ